jgi:UDP-glucose 4-epimerase
MHATVIGGRGFIGQVLVQHLHTLGWSVWVPERDHGWPDSERELGHIFYCAGLTADYLQHPERTVEAHVSLLARVLQSTHFTSLGLSVVHTPLRRVASWHHCPGNGFVACCAPHSAPHL